MPHARAGLGLGVRKLAAAAKVSPDTVIRFERGERIASVRSIAFVKFLKLLAWSSPMGASLG
jgi:transcriptional regulator with XRE-family HTH domain